MPTQDQRRYAFDGFVLDTQARELRDGDDAALALTAKAFDTLRYLIEHRDRIVGKDELLAQIWPGRIVEENNLTQAISALRRALGVGAGDHRYVVTVPGRGYRFVAELHDGITAPPARADSESALRRWRVPLVLATLLALVVLVAVVWQARRPSPSSAKTLPVAALAVLPFRPLTDGRRDELLELGLADTLIARLSRSTPLRVRSLASVQRFAGPKQDPLEAARSLGVGYVVEGSTQLDGDRVRVNARLLTVANGATVWADTFDAPLDQAFILQDRIAQSVASALSLKLAALPARSRHPCDGGDSEAYRAYLTGRYLINRPDPARLPQAMAGFHRAIDLDPSCARAYAGMAFAYRALVITGDRDPREVFPLAKAAAKQALAIDPESAEAYASLGFVQFWYDWDWAAAEASFKRSIALDPGLADARLGYAQLLNVRGRVGEGLAQARRARELDPLSPLINTLEGGFLAAAGQRVEARQRIRQAFDLQPGFWITLLYRGDMELDDRDYPAAIADLQRASERSHGASPAYASLGVAYAASGDDARARAVLAALESRDQAGYVPATRLAALHNALGDIPGALTLLERAYAERDLGIAFLGYERGWNNLRAQPRFEALARRLDLPSKPGSGHY
jgi:DNA-binding winged helix-turn-helix (wHTH) protein/TolB-like protein/Flp pilus assembly protein TadD